MRHGRRTLMTTADIDQALRVLNIEPLYGHSPYNPATFRRALPFPQIPAAGPVYFPEDEEIDFDRVLREEKIALPKGVSWTAHWLAVEGVQPLTPENPPAIPRESDGDPLAKGELLRVTMNGIAPPTGLLVNGTAAGTGLGLDAAAAGAKKPGAGQQQNQQIVKQVLSRELQLYYARLTSSLLPPSADVHKRTAALASLRNDAGLQALLPYLVRWVGEGVVGVLKEDAPPESEGRVLEVLLDAIGAILDNSTLFVEPYVRVFAVISRLLTDTIFLFPLLHYYYYHHRSYTKSCPQSSPSSCTPPSRPATPRSCAPPPRRRSPSCSRSTRRRTPRSRRAS